MQAVLYSYAQLTISSLAVRNRSTHFAYPR